MLSDLHRHLDGSLRPGTVAELAARQRVDVPRDLAFRRGMGLHAALEKFDFLLKLIQHPAEVRRVASEICEDAAREGVTTLEIRFAPQLHKGASIEAIVDAALEGIAGRAGLILCGLYGEPPELIERLVSTRGARGIDLAGGPSTGDSFRLADYARAFRLAEKKGLGRTVHAGEGRAAAEIAVAIEALHAQRIGHGTTLLDDPRVRDLVVERGVTIEACLTSNVHTGVIASQERHPLPQWLAQGVRCCVNTDNTLLSQTDAPREYAFAEKLVGAGGLEKLVRHGREAAF